MPTEWKCGGCGATDYGMNPSVGGKYCTACGWSGSAEQWFNCPCGWAGPVSKCVSNECPDCGWKSQGTFKVASVDNSTSDV